MVTRFFFLFGTAMLALLTLSVSAEELKFYSQFQQDSFLYHNVFKQKRNGIFVDIGAHDGVIISNTYFFEKFMGWTGICVEPIPEVFASLKANRRCICVHGCVSETSGIKPFLSVNGPGMLSGLCEKFDPRHLARIKKEVAERGGSSEVIQMLCYTFNELLLGNNIAHVDYLSIDTEGGELDILKSIDFSRFKIDIIDVENNYKDHSFQKFLKPLGYKKIATLGVDEIYMLMKR